MTDEKIVELYWERSEEAIKETDKQYGRYFHYIAKEILQDEEDAKETVNDTYLKAFHPTIQENIATHCIVIKNYNIFFRKCVNIEKKGATEAAPAYKNNGKNFSHSCRCL